MKTEQPLNRVAEALDDWRSKEERLNRLFAAVPSKNRAVLSEKLRHYDIIAAKFKYTDNAEERMALRVLNQERRQIERQLYPNFWVRLFRRLFVAPAKAQIAISGERRMAGQSNEVLQMQLQRTGFTGVAEQVAKKINEGQPQFNLPNTYYVNNKERLEHELSFSKGQDGRYRFDGFMATVVTEGTDGEKKQHFFSMQKGLEVNTTEAYNLMSGRPLERDGKWLQFDLNDKDAQGNYRIKEFHSGYGYDLDKTLQMLPLKERNDRIAFAKLKEDLKQGQRTEVTLLKNGNEQRYFIEANPQYKSVNIYDEHSRKISLNTALGVKPAEAVRLVNNEKQEQQEKQGKQRNLRIS